MIPRTSRPQLLTDARTGDGITVTDVGMTFLSASGSTEAVRSVTGTVRQGQFVSLIGPSGCGKSTVLDIIGGLQTPTTGSVVIGETPVTGPRRDTAMIFQEDSTLHWRTVLGNVEFASEVAGASKPHRRDRARYLINLLGLQGFEHHYPRQLSGGMRQRVAIARALCQNPRTLLMDEPFGALDSQTRLILGRELMRIWEETAKTIVLVTHDLQEAVYLSDEVWVMSHRPSRIKEKIFIPLDRPRPPGTMRTAEFATLSGYLWDLLEVDS